MVRSPPAVVYNWWRTTNYDRRIWARSYAVTGETIRSYEPVNTHRKYDADPLLERLLQDVRPGEVVYDVGANVGTYSLVLGKRLADSGGSVVAFEATPAVAEWLRANVAASGLEDVVQVVAAATSDSAGTTELYAGRAHRRNSILPEDLAHDHEPEVIEVPTRRLDEFDGPTPDRIKIDVEGAELRVLRGAEGLLESARPVLYVEPHGHGYTMDEMRSYLRGFGYELEENGVIIARPYS